jgi:hypothetical protein
MTATAEQVVGLRVRRYAPEDLDAVNRLNRRFAAAAIPHVLYPEDERQRVAAERASWVRDRLFVASEQGEIRAGVWLKEQDFWVDGRTVRAGWAKYPVSESLVDRAYAGVPGSLLFQVLREQPRLMALGLGGHDGPFARLLAGMRWPGLTIPFFVLIARPSRVARELSIVRTTPLRRAMLDLLGWSGAAWAVVRLASTVRAMALPSPPGGYTAHLEPRFSGWADDVWRDSRASYGFLATRDGAALDQIYTDEYRGVSRLRVEHGGKPVGWACVHRMDGRRPGATAPFGRLVVGVLADCFAAPEHAFGVSHTATRYLLEEGADLLISHQSHSAWGTALANLGWLERPSRFAFYRSPQMNALIGGSVHARTYHLTRGDCDGLMRV